MENSVKEKLSKHVENIFKKEDEYGLSPEEWAFMGHQFHNELIASGKTVSEIARWSSLSEAQIIEFANGKVRIPANQLDVLCGVLGTNAEYLFAPWVERIYKAKESASKGAKEYEPAGVTLGDFYVPIMNNAFPPSKQGDILAVHEQVTAENGDLVVVELNKSQLIRRYERVGDTVLLRCDNPNYQTIVLSGDEAKGLRIIGKATYFIIKAV